MNVDSKMNPNHIISVAKELTIVAIENGLIPNTTSAAETANNVVDFYKTIVNTINEDN